MSIFDGIRDRIWPFGKNEQPTGDLRLNARAGLTNIELMARITSSLPDKPTAQNVKAARRAAVKDPYGRRFLQLLDQHVLGPQGIEIEVRDYEGGQSDEFKRIQREWEKFTRDADIRGRGWREYQRDAIKRLARDGEIINQKVLVRGAMQFKLRDSLTLPYEINDKQSNMMSSIVFSTVDDRPTAYLFRNSDNDIERVRADQIIHVFHTDDPDTVRGLTWMMAALNRVEIVDNYDDSFQIGIRNAAASPGGFVPGERNAEDVEALDAIATKLKPGSKAVFPPGTTWVDTSSGQQFDGSNYRDTRQTMLEPISSALGPSYHAMTTDVSRGNLASLRVGMSSDRSFYKITQATMTHFLGQLFKEWMIYADILGIADMRLMDEIKLVFRTPGMDPIDQNKEAMADEKEIASGTNSRRGVMREKGREPDRIFRELEEEERMLSSASRDESNEE